jgi:lipopolysaccharide transport system ATP-binding protein
MSEISIRARGLSKVYHVYERPQDRLWQAMIGNRRKLFREFWALRGVDFEVARGETVGIIGRNGSGKSTLLQLVAGTLRPTEGSVEVNGRVAALLELGSGFNPEFSGRDNVMFSGALFGIDSRDMARRFDAIAEFADIGDFIEQPVKSYSSGMGMRLAFAVMAHVDADVLIIDEALSVGDAYFSQKCMRFLHEFRRRGTLLFVSHDTAAVTTLCDRAIWLDHGGVRAIGDAKDVSEAYLEDVFAGRQEVSGDAAPVRAAARRAEERHDQRRELLTGSGLRNDIEVFDFDPAGARGFGAMGMTVESVTLRDEHGKALAWIVGGEMVALEVRVVAHRPIRSVIVGFYLKDRLGQFVFGDNTWISHTDRLALAAGETARATFRFQMPRLKAGDYWIAVGIAEGTQEDHVQHQWLHDALHLKAEGGDVTTGLVGLPMYDISLERADA